MVTWSRERGVREKEEPGALDLSLDLSDPADTGQMFGYCDPRVHVHRVFLQVSRPRSWIQIQCETQ